MATSAFLAFVPPASGQSGLLPGRVENRTSSCGAAETLTVQVSGSDLSPRVEVAPDRPTSLALPRGLYGVTVIRADGSLLEETRTLVLGDDFVLAIGCAGVASAAVPAPAAPARADGTVPEGFVPVRFVNTSGDCGEPREVEFRVDRRPVGTVADRGEVRGLLRVAGAVVDVMSGDRRLLTYSVARPRAGQALVFGCTYPDSAGSADGVPVAFENTTDQCPDASSRRSLTLWVDGLPVTGIGPGGKTGVRIRPGRHEFEVRVGWSRERVVRGAKEVLAPFRIHYGCGR